MPTEFTTANLGDFIEFQRGFDLPQQKRAIGNHPIVSSSGITDYHSESMVASPGVVTGRYGTIGKVFYLDQPFWPLNTTLWVKDFKGNHPKFVYYFLHTLDFNSCADKSSVPGVNRNDLHSISVKIPDIQTQQAIAETLSSLDNKIELNRQMNKTLEAMAQTLFKSWFVDFDPVKAKAEGREPEGMDDITAALFPSDFTESLLGTIPEGWEVKDLGSLSSVAIGRTPPRKEHHWFSENPSYKKWISIRDLGTASVYITQVSEYLTDEAINKFRIPIIKAGTVILSFKLTMGRVAITAEDMYSNEAIAQFNLDESPLNPSYLYLHLKNYDYSILGSTSSIATAVNSQSLKTIKVIVPKPDILEAFEQQIMPIMQKIKNNIFCAEMLKEARDLLLPRLISDKLRVGEISETVEALAS